jgi:hypothetical protein
MSEICRKTPELWCGTYTETVDVVLNFLLFVDCDIDVYFFQSFYYSVSISVARASFAVIAYLIAFQFEKNICTYFQKRWAGDGCYNYPTI